MLAILRRNAWYSQKKSQAVNDKLTYTTKKKTKVSRIITFKRRSSTNDDPVSIMQRITGSSSSIMILINMKYTRTYPTRRRFGTVYNIDSISNSTRKDNKTRLRNLIQPRRVR